ncbi:pyridoxal 5'-phosphate synthase glutaminase subunit PdxT [Listeria monocytogenes]|uniref:pyridoxal 5'-phosphate synthase glutaminase subunit PdxT n=1 Tax=Listeria monocytogenes TaxID=1639 RepID=UPI0010E252CF|nr:pyridoxal 5'-phosphate synthase glutaminase subunit PdxT [Listeria monocytogenes]EAC8434219.1 pyridoxal 5'-phosphate synthase glutaminase subunit PdxT [Listeria monocytogenes]EAE2395605.1 pyridoxal 5'-phosphate synthase glutaminase subunit PdxT [Listeria monocytogenes]EAE7945388.1 pyridoxal 5'-phosphate synthase glutaminase subunit PdxT [Listeria monocytogenes]EBH4175690.1 pyridoxal 5'-phosphate synthase glutaminase subunit PdxT [Listeria monocytogenes]EEU7815515.1 pyridoxal 5'-phosphate sy
MKKIGVLAIQGAVDEHIQMIESAGALAFKVKHSNDLDELDGLVLPGGESTTMRKIMKRYDLMEPVKAFAKEGKAIFGTCAGLVLLSKEIEGGEESLGLLDATAIRNGFGRQKESFEAELSVDVFDAPTFEAIFIRAPYLIEPSDEVTVLATIDGKIVAAKQANILVTAFHPELTNDNRWMRYFLEKIL